MNKEFNDFIITFNEINSILLKYDCIISPYYSNGEIKKLESIAKRLPLSPTPDEKERYAEMISSTLYKENFNYHFRSIILVEGYMTSDWFCNNSHIIEIGMLEFYRFNFVSCTAIWFPFVEGILRNVLNIPLGQQFNKTIHLSQLKQLQAKNSELQPFMDSLTLNLAQFLENVFFKNVHASNELPSYNFNRHFFGHNLSPAPYFYSINCLRLINIFDTFLALNFIQDSYFKTLFDGTDSKVKIREKYYEDVVRDAMSDINLYKMELLKQHQNFNENEYYGKYK